MDYHQPILVIQPINVSVARNELNDQVDRNNHIDILKIKVHRQNPVDHHRIPRIRSTKNIHHRLFMLKVRSN